MRERERERHTRGRGGDVVGEGVRGVGDMEYGVSEAAVRKGRNALSSDYLQLYVCAHACVAGSLPV